ncbi:MAG TPA: OmpA family protein [Alphaproteobacteria bacterium]|nr:OmpA family protein [Alphaproteobacteria bacterium]
MLAHGFKLYRLLLVMALAGLGTGAGHTTAAAAEAGAGEAKPIQCTCCWERKGGYPPAHCAFFCDKGGRFDLVYFAPGSSELTPIARKTLRKQANCLKRNKFGTILSAGADSHETPDEKTAKLLSERRAATVKKFFVSRGIPRSSIKSEAEGLLGQGTAGRTPDEQRLNRYVWTRDGESWN